MIADGTSYSVRAAATGVAASAEKTALGIDSIDIVPVNRYNPTLLVCLGIIVAE